MSKLNLEPNLESADEFYETLLEAHEGLGEEESHAFNARLVLILANQIGDQATLAAAIHAAHLSPAGTEDRRPGPVP